MKIVVQHNSIVGIKIENGSTKIMVTNKYSGNNSCNIDTTYNPELIQVELKIVPAGVKDLKIKDLTNSVKETMGMGLKVPMPGTWGKVEQDTNNE